VRGWALRSGNQGGRVTALTRRLQGVELGGRRQPDSAVARSGSGDARGRR
jgi:hypothetical protein